MSEIKREFFTSDDLPTLADRVPYWTGVRLCDFSDVQDGDIVYCDTNELKHHTSKIRHLKNLVIISGNSDTAVFDGVQQPEHIHPAKPYNHYGLNTEVLAGCFDYWFTVNNYSKLENVISIPIGFPPQRVLKQHTDDYNARMNDLLNTKGGHHKTALLQVDVRTNKTMREYCIAVCRRNPDIDVIDRIWRGAYLQTLGDYKFIISPQGNGVDCFRNFEALAAGCIPIIRKRYPLERVYKDLPVLFVDDWSDLIHMDLDTIYAEMAPKIDKSMLMAEYWISRIKTIIATRENHEA